MHVYFLSSFTSRIHFSPFWTETNFIKWFVVQRVTNQLYKKTVDLFLNLVLICLYSSLACIEYLSPRCDLSFCVTWDQRTISTCFDFWSINHSYVIYWYKVLGFRLSCIIFCGKFYYVHFLWLKINKIY